MNKLRIYLIINCLSTPPLLQVELQAHIESMSEKVKAQHAQQASLLL
jgi:hypothetical protein